MAAKGEQSPLEIYAALMEEIKIRISAIDQSLVGRTGLIPPLVNEFCFLQLRMVCELIALGCLVAHGDIKSTKIAKLNCSWSAGEIIKALESLHVDFYPVPVIQRMEKTHHFQLDKFDGAFLTKEELFVLYNRKCGDVLHRGSVKKLISDKHPFQRHFHELNSWKVKIMNLLNHHQISLVSGNVIVCGMSMTSLAGRVQVVLGQPQSSPL